MSINSLSDWGKVELAAQTHELSQVETPKMPLATIEQQLTFATMQCASLEAKIHRMQSAMSSAMMYLSIGESGRATEQLNKGLLDL